MERMTNPTSQPRAKAQTLRLSAEPLFFSLYFDIPPYFLI